MQEISTKGYLLLAGEYAHLGGRPELWIFGADRREAKCMFIVVLPGMPAR